MKYVLAGDEDKVKLLTEKPAKLQEQANKALEKAKKMKEKAKTKEEKIAATEKDLAAKALKKEAAEAKYQEAHLTKTVPNQSSLSKKIETWNDKIKKMELNIKHKDDNKEVSLGTSKVSVELSLHDDHSVYLVVHRDVILSLLIHAFCFTCS